MIVSIRALGPEGPAPDRGGPTSADMGRDMSTSLYEITDENIWFGCVKHKIKYQARVSALM